MPGCLRRVLAPLSLLILLFASSAIAAPSQPFRWSWSFGKDGLSIGVFVPPGHYLYTERTEVSVSIPGQGAVPASKSPAAIEHADELGESQVFAGGMEHSWLFPASSLKAPVKVEIAWQGCKDKTPESQAACLLPESVERTFDVLEGSGSFLDNPKEEAAPAGSRVKSRMASGYIPSDEFLSFLKGEGVPASQTTLFSGRGLLASLLLALIGGLALNLTPCVLPMIPVNLAIIGAGAGESSKHVRIAKGFVYAAGMALAYAALGIGAVLTGASFGQVNAEWWFNAGASFLFLFLGLAMFGIFELDLSRFGSKLKLPSAASFAGIFALGAVSALLAGACVAPVVLAALIQAASLRSQGDASGLLLPLALGVGMGLPWPLAAAGMSILPKPGPWMVRVKQALGAAIVALALYYAWTGGLMLAASFQPAGSGPKKELAALEKAVSEAKRDRKPLLIDFWATWCKSCKAMNATTLKSPAVKAELEKFVLLEFQAEHPSNPQTKAVLEKFGVAGLPTFVIVEPKNLNGLGI